MTEPLRAIVTAGGAGIGRAIVDVLAEEGARVITCDIDPDAVAEVGGVTGVEARVADVGSTSAIDDFMERALGILGGVDLLVNNAGIAGPAGRIETLDPETVTACLDVNLTSMVRTTRHAVPAMVAAGSGSIVNISSTAGLHGFPYRSAYAASKWAVIGLTKTIAMEVGGAGVRANVICPGSISGPRMDEVIRLEAAASGRDQDEIRKGFERQVSMRSFVDARDIAHMVAFLASPRASMISGQVISVDGNTETMRTD